jgi:tetratricopeptide (TPR) repeat protein
MTSESVCVVTSIPPKIRRNDAGRESGEAYQAMCVQSWLDCGFSVVSVNEDSEIRALAKRHPHVTFVSAPRDARTISGRSNPFITDLLLAACAMPAATVGIINSDILLEPSPWWRSELPKAAASSTVIMRRYDATSLADSALIPMPWGFDAFFMAKTAAQDVARLSVPFAIGLPWWDIWLPVALAARGYVPRLLTQPHCLHLLHQQNYMNKAWRFLGSQFADEIVRMRGTLPQENRELQAMAAVAQHILNTTGVEDGAADVDIHRLSKLCMDYVARSSANAPLDGAAMTDVDHAIQRGPFHRFAERMQAGHLIELAQGQTEENNLENAEKLLRDGLALAPMDVRAVTALTDLLAQQDRAADALTVLEHAGDVAARDQELCERYARLLLGCGAHAQAESLVRGNLRDNPGAAWAHFHLGLARRADGDHSAAKKSFRKTLELDPDHRGAAEALEALGGDASNRGWFSEIARRFIP